MATAKSNKKKPNSAKAGKSTSIQNKSAKGALPKTKTVKSGASKTASAKVGAEKKVEIKAGIKKGGAGKGSAKGTPLQKPVAAKSTAKKTTAVKTTAVKPTAAKSSAGKPSGVKTTAKKSAPKKPPPRKPAKSSGTTKETVFHLDHIDGRTLTKIVSKLEELREESQHIVNTHLQADLMPREESLDVGDDLDQASNERDREFNLIMHQRHLRRLHQIDEAFARLDDGSYGLCEGTDEPINPKRLLIMPLTKYSIEYQEMQEKTLGRDSLGGSFSETDESFGTDE